MEKIDKIVKRFISLIFPATCIACQKYGPYLCSSCCKLLIKRKNQQFNIKNFEKVFAVFYYSRNKLLQNLVHDIKYKAHYSKIDIISDPLNKIILNNFSNKEIVLIPIPIHHKRQIYRGFNQSEIIAQVLLNKSSLNMVVKINLIKRIKNTTAQVLLRKKDRINNLKGAFEIIKKEQINEKTVFIIIDDILSSGSTMENCALELKKHFSNPIYGLVIASDKL